MTEEARKSGIEAIGDIPWGTHFCQFYHTREDLLDLLVPYLQAGLENNEFCIWITTEIVNQEDAKTAMKKAMPDFDQYLNKGQIEILAYTDLYVKDGVFDMQKVLNEWINKLNTALSNGYDGMRATGDTFWLRKGNWKDYAEYEDELNNSISQHHMLAFCTYPLDKYEASCVIDIACSHELALVKHRNEWILMEIPTRMQTEETLRKSVKNYQILFDSTITGTYLSELGGIILSTNKSGAALLGYDHPKDLIGMNIRDFYKNPQDRRKVINGIKNGGIGSFELEMTRKDGAFITVLISTAMVEFNSEKVFLTSVMDITEIKQAEKILQDSEERYRTLVENANESIIVVQDDMLKFANNKAAEITGYTKEELTYMPAVELIHPDDRDMVVKRYTGRLQGKQLPHVYPFRVITKNGNTRWAEINAVQIEWEGRPASLNFITDITDRRQTEERYKALFESKLEGAVVLDKTMKILLANQAVADLFGLDSIDKTLQANIFDFVPPEDRERVLDIIAKDMLEKDLRQINEFRLLNKAGKEIWVSAVGTAIEYQGQPAGLVSLRDITEQKHAQEALRESEDKYHTILDSIEDGYWELGLDGNFTFLNASACHIVGYSRDELMEISYREFTTEKDVESVYKACNQVYQSGKAIKGIEWEIRRKNGDRGYMESSISPLRDPSGKIVGFRGITRDITERKKADKEREELEQKALRASHLASVGEMASGIAHEINNPLTGVIGYSELLMQKKGIPEDIKDDVKIINDGAQRVAGIVKGMLTFARQHKPKRKYININDIVTSTIDLRSYALNTNNIEVSTYLAPDLPMTHADAGQLQQVFLNIIVNAEAEMKQAHGKGKLTIKTERIDDTIKISFEDDGPGISRKNMARLFDPFFTTRKIGQGTGLGLSICHGIITEHDGHLYVESKLNMGATFIVELPVVTKPEQLEMTEPEVKASQKAQRARILIVDDESIVRDFLSDLLIGEGHEVDTTDNAADAIKMVENKRYNLILLDIKMPGMSGIELHKHFQEIARSLTHRIIFITGDVLGVDTQEFLSKTRAPYITKPFNIEPLKKEINDILNQST